MIRHFLPFDWDMTFAFECPTTLPAPRKNQVFPDVLISCSIRLYRLRRMYGTDVSDRKERTDTAAEKEVLVSVCSVAGGGEFFGYRHEDAVLIQHESEEWEVFG
jgi:hypothetical protein